MQFVRHYKVSLGRNDGSYALLSRREEPDSAIILVHGFFGDATRTWLNFQSLIDDVDSLSPIFDSSDLYFYEYDSIEDNVPVHSARLTKFIRQAYPRTTFPSMGILSPVLRKFIPIPEERDRAIERHYRRLILVGHSLGAVLIRQAIVDQAIEYGTLLSTVDPPPDQVARSAWLDGELRLFAPAIFGFDPVGFRGFFYRFLIEMPKLKIFIGPSLTSFAMYQDLEEGSRRLIELQKRTELLFSKYPLMPSLRGHLLFGAKEHVVYMDRYTCDPVYEIEEAQDPCSICKPDVSYLKPMEFVGHGLPRTASA